MGKGHRRCEVCGVKEARHTGNKLHFSKFPLEPNRCREWLKAVGNEELVHLPIEKLHVQRNVCANHFGKKDFNKKGNRLKRHAIPTLNLMVLPLTEDQLAEFPQYIYQHSGSKDLMPDAVPSTSQQSSHILKELSQNDLTPREKQLMEQLVKTKCSLASLRRRANLLEKLESGVLKEIVTSALKNQKRKLKGRRWTTANKISALAIFKRSPKAYRYLQHLMPLPSTKTLYNVLKKNPVTTGVNKAVIKHLNKVAVKNDISDRYCGLVFDEIALKRRLLLDITTDKVEGYEDFGIDSERSSQLADHALVFMLQGLRV